jgi:hypothetical protein
LKRDDVAQQEISQEPGGRTREREVRHEALSGVLV